FKTFIRYNLKFYLVFRHWIVFLTKILVALLVFILFSLGVVLPILYLYLKRKFRQEKSKKLSKEFSVGIFHPYCNAGGGGEKVLWVALQALQKKKNLNVDVDKNVKFIYLNKRKWVESDKYPVFTLLGQALGSVYLGFEALSKLNPDIFIDTTGFTFTLPLFKYLGDCKIGCYVHYPTITKDMLRRVSNRQAIYNNRGVIARSPILTMGKLIYYHVFAWAYSLAGQCADSTIVNSTFTMEHLNSLWNKPLQLVYPPCELREMVSEEVFNNITLVLCGGSRNADDSRRVKDLMDFSKHLSLEHNVEFKINISYEDLLEEFKKSYIGIHTMLDEHFGISVVEQMAAGLIVVAHRSGGPLLDIIETSESSRLGFLAQTPQEFAYIIKFILELNDDEVNEIRERAKASVERFSTKKFQDEFLRAIEPLFK
ncbi:hypothetical protein NQ314_002519, partial [Rhamnusium bicolor]